MPDAELTVHSADFDEVKAIINQLDEQLAAAEAKVTMLTEALLRISEGTPKLWATEVAHDALRRGRRASRGRGEGMTTSEQAAREAVMDAANSLAAATTLAYQYKVADRPERIPAEYAVGKGLQAMDAALDALTTAIEDRVRGEVLAEQPCESPKTTCWYEDDPVRWATNQHRICDPCDERRMRKEAVEIHDEYMAMLTSRAAEPAGEEKTDDHA